MCTLCGQCNDSVQHLFFQCPYSKKIWNNLKGMFYMDQANEDWDDIIDIILAMNCKNNIKSIMSKNPRKFAN